MNIEVFSFFLILNSSYFKFIFILNYKDSKRKYFIIEVIIFKRMLFLKYKYVL